MLTKVKVLMWKYLVMRKRRFIQTPIEYLSPLVCFIILFIYKDNITPDLKDIKRGPDIYKTETIEISHVNAPQVVFYSPDTETTRTIMERVGRKLDLPRLDFLTHDRVRGYVAIQNATFWRDPSRRGNNAVVLFQNMEESLPLKLNYTIRMRLPYSSMSSESTDGKGPHAAYGTEYEPFIRLQWAIDSSFLEVATDKRIKQQVSLQEFPYASSVKNPIAQPLSVALQFICWISVLLVFVFLSSRMLEERVTGVQEMIKMVGVSGLLVNVCHFLNVAPIGILQSVVATILLTVTANPILPNTSPLLIWLLLILYFITMMAFAFLVSGMMNKSQYGVTFASVMYAVSWVPTESVCNIAGTSPLQLLRGLLPHMPMRWFWMNVGKLEEYGHGVTFGNMGQIHVNTAGSVLICYIYLVIQAVVFCVLGWYLYQVNPGPYGQAQPWNFIISNEFLGTKKKVNPVEEAEELSEEDLSDPQYFEPPRLDADVGIKVVNVSKVFPKHKALTNVSLDVYKDEITVLLGHNGAGKTTLMSIITGMLSATNGKVYVAGMDTATQKEQMRKKLGLCPQHNLFFSGLTILEHVLFFSMLKGVSYAQAKESSMSLLQQLGIADKANYNSSQLSGGMKRRLQLACALAGDSTVLVLDEPTSGLDVETRRELWDLLLSLRGNRTVLLSTHFMEEADALGDRVAALHNGRLRCLASPMHLKRALGSGYRLTLNTIGLPNERAITSAIASYVPDATVKEQSLNGISYNLPAKNSKSFPKLFNSLESKRSELGIESIGVGVSTLEEVFLKLCSDVTTTFNDDKDMADFMVPAAMRPKLTGFMLCLHQFWVLFKRQFKFTWSHKVSFLCLEVLLPIAFIVMLSYPFPSGEDPKENTNVAMNLDLFKYMPERRVLYTLNVTDDPPVSAALNWYPGVTAKTTPNVPNAVLRAGMENILDYNKYLVGIEMNDTDVKMLYTTVVNHAAPVAMNLLSNMVAASLKVPDADGHIITTYSHPFERSREALRTEAVKPKPTMMIFIWALFIVFIILATVINGVTLPCKERVAGSRHLHILAGALPEVPWLATLAAQTLKFVVVLVIPTIIAAEILETESTINQPDFLGVLALVLVLGIMAFLAFAFLFTFCLSETGATLVLVAVIVLFGILTSLTRVSIETFDDDVPVSFKYHLLQLLEYVIPADTLSTAVLKSGIIARANARCNLNENLCASPSAEPNTLHLDEVPTYKCYLCFQKGSPAPDIVILIVQIVLYMTLVVLAERGAFKSLCDRVFNVRYVPPQPLDADESVRAERQYVTNTITLPKNQIQDALLANNLHKNYPRIFGKSCNAVKGVSFSVKEGEVFGLLGVNGAGKSTVFKMLTGVEHPTRGNVFASGYHLNHSYGQYLKSLSYCPQFFGLDTFLTGLENLSLILTLHGLSPADVTAEATSWIEIVGLEKYSKRAVSSYSGGCARRLAAAAALCGRGRVALLDEPSAGVDVAARRRLWAAVRRAAARRAVIISSHSMDETEALCGRIAIMAAGRVRALGSASALRAAHAAGHAILIRITAPGTDVTDSAKSEVTRLKNRVGNTFNCTLKDEHKSMLHYHVNDTMRYSQLFADLEKLKQEFPELIQDYSVTETTLEEVFLSFAADSHREEGPAAV